MQDRGQADPVDIIHIVWLVDWTGWKILIPRDHAPKRNDFVAIIIVGMESVARYTPLLRSKRISSICVLHELTLFEAFYCGILAKT